MPYPHRFEIQKGCDNREHTCSIHMWGDAQEHRASIRRKSSLDFLQETVAVKAPCGICNCCHTCLPLYTWCELRREMEYKEHRLGEYAEKGTKK